MSNKADKGNGEKGKTAITGLQMPSVYINAHKRVPQISVGMGRLV